LGKIIILLDAITLASKKSPLYWWWLVVASIFNDAFQLQLRLTCGCSLLVIPLNLQKINYAKQV